MKPQLHNSLKVAHKVLRLINVKAPRNAQHHLTITGYENGREHGLSLGWFSPEAAKDIRVWWAECRNSDEIVVYVSQPKETFGCSDAQPTQRAYNEATYFKYDQHQKAADFISRSVGKLMAAQQGKGK